MHPLSIDRKAAFGILGFNNTDKMVFLPKLVDTRDYITLLEYSPSLIGEPGTMDSFAWAFVLAREDSTSFPLEFISLTVHRKLPGTITAQFSLEKRWRYPPDPVPSLALLSRSEMIAAVCADESLIIQSYTQIISGSEIQVDLQNRKKTLHPRDRALVEIT